MILAIKLLEDPPLKHEAPRVLRANTADGIGQDMPLDNAEDYQNSYGLLPVDSVAAREILGCPIRSRESLKTKVRPEQVAEYAAIYRRVTETAAQYLRVPRVVSRTFDDLNEEIEFDQAQLANTQVALANLTGALAPDQERRRSRLAADLENWKNSLSASMARKKQLSQRPEFARYVALKAKSDEIDQELNAYQARVTAGLGDIDKAAALCVLKGKRQCYGMSAAQKSVPTITIADALADAAPQKLCTSPEGVGAGDGLTFSTGHPDGCCVNVKAAGDAQGTKVLGQLRTALAISYARDRVQRDAKPGAKISWVLQGYNGRGCFGCTEGHGYYDKGCLGNIDMKQRPVYGAKAADLVVNTLMRNPEIVAMVDQAAERAGARPPSVLCLTSGAGVHQISDRTFLDEQARYLLRAEPARAKLCAPLFRNQYRSSAAAGA